MVTRNIQHKVRTADVEISAEVFGPLELFGLEDTAADTERDDLVILGGLHLAEAFVIGIYDKRATRLVIGTPIWLLKLPFVAWVLYFIESTAFVISFVVVLPLLPVMATFFNLKSL